VLQSTTVFSNVSKGVLAKREDLLLVFGTDDEQAICLRILREGEFQVSDKERKVELDTLFRDVASVLSEKCVNPETSRPYTLSMLERALKDAHFNLDPKRPAKAQALEALPLLQARFPIERARMRLRLLAPLAAKEEVYELLASRAAVIEDRDLMGSMLSVTCLVEPGAYRQVHALVQGAGGGGRVELVALAATTDVAEATAGIETLALRHTAPAQQPMVLPGGEDGGAVLVAPPPQAPAAPAAEAPPPARQPVMTRAPPSEERVVYKGPVEGLPEEHASRRERFAELDAMQPGWTLELRARGEGSTLEALFFSPAGERVGSFAVARRMAMQAKRGAA
jgi:ribosome maturation protein SDO1